MKSLAVALLLATVSGQDWDYKENGGNWGLDYEACKEQGGSPIDLKTATGSYKTLDVDSLDGLKSEFTN
jgi:hypothetical protein